MSLRIETEHDEGHIYRPGQTLRGQVVYTTVKQRKIGPAYISFRGKISTKYLEKRHAGAGNTHGPRKQASEDLRLFDVRKELFDGPYSVAPQTFTWPFEFLIPELVRCHRPGKLRPGFVKDGMQILPPSFDFFNASFSHDASARVKYKLSARVEVAGVFRDDNQELLITIARLARSLPSVPQSVPHQFETQQWSSRTLRVEKVSAIQEFKRLFNSDPALKVPCIAFQASVHLPLAASTTQRFGIGFTVRPVKITQNDPTDPTLILESIRLSLKSATTIIALRSGLSMSGDKFTPGTIHGLEHQVEFEPVRLPLDGTTTMLNDDLRLADWMENDNSGLVPDFTTYTIHYRHWFEVYAVVRHKESGHLFQMETRPRFELREPHPTQIGLDRYGSTTGVIEQVARAEEESVSGDSELPGYNDDVRPPELGIRQEGSF